MEIKSKRIDNVPYSIDVDNRVKIIKIHQNIENMNQEINKINKTISRYHKLEDLIKNESKSVEERELDLKKLQKYIESKMESEHDDSNLMTPEKKQIFGEQVSICKKVYNPKIKLTENSNNIKTYKNKFKETMKMIFGKNDTFHGRNRNSILFNKIRIHNKIFKSNLDLSKKLLTESNNNSIIEKTIKNKKRDEQDLNLNDYDSTKEQKQIQCSLPISTINADKRINYSYGNYATNKIIFKHPQIYLLNNSSTPMRNKLPPINVMYRKKLNKIDLLSTNDSDFDKSLDTKQKKYDDYYMAMRIGKALKYKFY
jgi:hypothetical protein